VQPRAMPSNETSRYLCRWNGHKLIAPRCSPLHSLIGDFKWINSVNRLVAGSNPARGAKSQILPNWACCRP
jgi:hypothetical protein